MLKILTIQNNETKEIIIIKTKQIKENYSIFATHFKNKVMNNRFSKYRFISCKSRGEK